MGLATAAPAQGSAKIPTLPEPSEPERGTGESKTTAQRETAAPSTSATANGEEKKKKRSLFGFGKKKTEEPAKPAPTSKTTPTTTTRTKTTSPIQTDHAPLSPSSPGRSGFASSPRLASPAGSQIFERDVQESAAALIPTSPAIPSHIQTENYIPPVLDASSEAITDDHLNPDTVEIITHTSHRGAATSLSPYTAATATASEPPSWADELAAFSSPATTTDTASNYGSFDATDVRRLSFISFADVVQAEQHQQQQQHPAGGSPSRDSMYVAGLTSFSPAVNRSPSPIRSPVSSAGGLGSGGSAVGVSPPTSKSGSVKGLEMPLSKGRTASPASGRRIPPLGSPTSLMSMQLGGPGSGGSGGEIAIETMSQALRRTGSGDLSGGGGGVRSFPASPI